MIKNIVLKAVMKSKRINNRSIFFFVALLILLSQTLSAQEIKNPVDTIKKVPKTIALADISVKSGEEFVNTKRIEESLISDSRLKKLVQETDSTLAGIDSLLQIERESDYSRMGFRMLSFRKVFWSDYQAIVQSNKSKLSDVVKNLDNIRYALKEKINVWNQTKDLVVGDESAVSVVNRINKLTLLMDSVNKEVVKKNSYILASLDKATDYSIRIESIISSLDKTQLKKSEDIFKRQEKGISISLTGGDYWLRIISSLKIFYNTEISQFKRFVKNQSTGFVIETIILLLLISMFVLIKKRLKNSSSNETFYKERFIQIIQSPVSSAVLMALLASMFVLKNRPPIFRDISVLVATISIIIILIPIFDKKYLRYVIVFGFLIVLRQFLTIFPENSILFYIALILVATIEIVGISLLIKSHKRFVFKSKSIKNLFLFALFIHLLFSITGLFAALTNYLILAEITTRLTVINAFTGLVLLLATQIINGILEIFVDSRAGKKINSIRLNAGYLKKKLPGIINFIAGLYWFTLMLSLLDIDRTIFIWVESLIKNEITIGSAKFTLLNVFTFFFILWLSTVLSKLVRVVLEEDVLRNVRLAKGVPRTISVMARYTIVTFGILLAISAAGVPLTTLTILISAFGVGIGFGLQNIFNNLVSGLILLFERPIQLGDTVEVGPLIGKVSSMGFRSSHIRTFDGAEVIVPNGHLISNEVVNWTLSDQQRRIEVIVGVAYGSDTRLVHKLMTEILQNHKDILQDPEPVVFFQSMGESSLDFRLLFWTANFGEWLRIKSEIIFEVYDVLKENNIAIPFPQRDLHLRSVDRSIDFFNREHDNNK